MVLASTSRSRHVFSSSIGSNNGKFGFTEAVVVLGSLYWGVLLYLVLFTLLADLLKLVDRVFHFFRGPLGKTDGGGPDRFAAA